MTNRELGALGDLLLASVLEGGQAGQECKDVGLLHADYTVIHTAARSHSDDRSEAVR